MRAQSKNAVYGILDYAVYPLAMVSAAPVMLRQLGAAQYGVWVVCAAVVSTGGIIASGFGDANIQQVAGHRSRRDAVMALRTVRTMIAINFVLGVLMAVVTLACASTLARHVVASNAELYRSCRWALCLASGLIVFRALESVCISTQRAFERYGQALWLSGLVRVATVAAAVGLSCLGYGVTPIMVVGVVLMSAGTALQIYHLKRLLAATSLWPTFDRVAFNTLLGFGSFSWLQAVSSVLFGQADRLILGVVLGASSVTSYALSVQIAQPIYGVAAAGLHFLFPYLAGRHSATEPRRLLRSVLVAFTVNLLFVASCTAVLLSCGPFLLRLWLGTQIAQAASVVFAPIVWSFAFLGLNVTAYYALLAVGKVRAVTSLNLFGGLAMICLMAWLLPRTGVRGVALARCAYGLVTLAMYVPLARLLFANRNPGIVDASYTVCEEV